MFGWCFIQSSFTLRPTNDISSISWSRVEVEGQVGGFIDIKDEYSSCLWYIKFLELGFFMLSWMIGVWRLNWTLDLQIEMGIRWYCAGFFLLVVVALDAGYFCDGGVTSSFARTNSISADMPLDSDVFRVPPGYNAPQQVWFQCHEFVSKWSVPYRFDFEYVQVHELPKKTLGRPLWLIQLKKDSLTFSDFQRGNPS